VHLFRRRGGPLALGHLECYQPLTKTGTVGINLPSVAGVGFTSTLLLSGLHSPLNFQVHRSESSRTFGGRYAEVCVMQRI